MANPIATLRYEFLQFGTGHTARGAEVVSAERFAPLKSGFLEVTDVPTPDAKQVRVPPADDLGEVFLRLFILNAAQAYVSVGPNPDPTKEPRILIFPPNLRLVAVRPGDRISAMTTTWDSFVPTAGG